MKRGFVLGIVFVMILVSGGWAGAQGNDTRVVPRCPHPITVLSIINSTNDGHDALNDVILFKIYADDTGEVVPFTVHAMLVLMLAPCLEANHGIEGIDDSHIETSNDIVNAMAGVMSRWGIELHSLSQFSLPYRIHARSEVDESPPCADDQICLGNPCGTSGTVAYETRTQRRLVCRLNSMGKYIWTEEAR